MSEWKPGDVVAATVNGRPNVRLIAGWSKYDPRLRWGELSTRWADGDDDECWFMPSQVTDHRPLVVINPEDREQMERVWLVMRDGLALRSRDNMRDALRSLIAPPKPYTEHDGAEPPWPVTSECHGHKWVAWTARRAGSGIPIRCATCGVRKCDREMCALERHHSDVHSDLAEGVTR